MPMKVPLFLFLLRHPVVVCDFDGSPHPRNNACENPRKLKRSEWRLVRNG